METENKYQRGKIYKLISNQTDDVYYGSTIENVITNRLSKHRIDYRRWINNKSHYVTSYEVVKYDDCKIILVENFPCNTKYELTAREQYYIESNKCINKNKAPTGLTVKEYNKEYYKNDYENRSERLKRNEEHIKEVSKKYREIHMEEIHLKLRKYYEDNKEKIQEKRRKNFTCNCGSKITTSNILRHEQSKKHMRYLNSLPKE